MKALANLFQNSADNNSVQDRVNSRDVLLGLSVFFKNIAMASESNPMDDLELGPLDSSTSRLGIRVVSKSANLKSPKNLTVHSITQVALHPLILLIWSIPTLRTLSVS